MAEAGLFQRRLSGAPLVYNIPAHRSFSDALAIGGRILLPNNRAVRTVTEAFVRASNGGLVLPRLLAVGDPDIGERIGGALDPLDLDLVEDHGEAFDVRVGDGHKGKDNLT